MTPDSYISPRDERMAVVQQVAQQHGVTVAQIMGTARTPEIVEARWEAMHRHHVLFGDGYARIGRFFGRDHTSVMHALKKRGAL